MELNYDTQVEVSEKVANIMFHNFRGIIARRSEGGRYFIKRLYPGYREITERALNSLINQE